MSMHLRYLRAVLRHKWFVLWAGLGSVPLWRLLIHDWSKFTPTEWFPYAQAFYGSGGGKTGKPSGNDAFDRAWLHHQKFNLHHWQYWIVHEDSGKVFCLPMPPVYRAEMVADWRGANRAYGDTPLLKWYDQTRAARMLHPETRAWVERELGHNQKSRHANAAWRALRIGGETMGIVEDFAPIPASDYGWCDYGALVETMNVAIVARADDNDYSGDSLMLVRQGDRFGFLTFGWGSCSGCDALQGCDTAADVEALRRDLANGIVWHEGAGAMRAFLVGRDWSMGYLDRGLVDAFLPQALAALDAA